MPAYQKLASHVVWKCLKSLCGGGWVGGGAESEFSDSLWPRPSQTIECLIDQSPNNQAIHKF